MYFQDRIEDTFAVVGTSIVGSGFTGAIPASTSIVSYGGEHTDNKGFVSDSNYLQNKYYQKYSYVVKSNVVSDSYKSIIKGALHPAGLIEFDELVITNLLSVSDALRVLKAEFIKSFNEGLDTADDTLFSIFKVLIDSISITDLYIAVINKNILDEGFVATDNDIKSIIKSLTDTLESTSLIDDISSMGINKNILDDIYTTDDALRSIIKSLTDSSSVNDLSSLGINKGIIDSFGFSHTQQIDKNPYAVDYFNQPVVGTDAYTDSRI
jgi:6-pyruvoyl-tetrahydropterin synthase